MFLTDAELAPASRAEAAAHYRQMARDLGHALIWTLFSDQQRESRPFLYREIERGRWLILSQVKPRADIGWNLNTKPFAPVFFSGQSLRFRLRANPAITLPRGHPRAGAKVDGIMHAKRPAAERAVDNVFGPEEEQAAALSWLFAREDAMGLTIDREAALALDYRPHRVMRGGDKPIRFSSVDYQGAGVVSDPAVLMAALANGVGRARAFGCGLLLVRPA